MTSPLKGPASYFPSIEKKHGLGHGHANALVAHTLAERGAN
ncbi:DUF4287 domain-containing protein [Streptomyces seoulensis]|nr:DUF4287 domain-containing protein [Streptomyces seoulensis]